MILTSNPQTLFVSDTPILPSPSWTSSSSKSFTPTSTSTFSMAPPTPEMNKIVAISRVHSLKAAVFHTMAYKMSMEINKNAITNSTKRSFLKVLYNVCQIEKKNINFEQYLRIHDDGPQIATICETTSDSVFVLHSPFTTNDHYFQIALEEAIDAFNAILVDFG